MKKKVRGHPGKRAGSARAPWPTHNAVIRCSSRLPPAYLMPVHCVGTRYPDVPYGLSGKLVMSYACRSGSSRAAPGMCIEPESIVSKQEIPPPGTMHIPTLLIDLAGCAASSALWAAGQYYPLHPDGFSVLDLVGARSSPHNCVFAGPQALTIKK